MSKSAFRTTYSKILDARLFARSKFEKFSRRVAGPKIRKISDAFAGVPDAIKKILRLSTSAPTRWTPIPKYQPFVDSIRRSVHSIKRQRMQAIRNYELYGFTNTRSHLPVLSVDSITLLVYQLYGFTNTRSHLPVLSVDSITLLVYQSVRTLQNNAVVTPVRLLKPASILVMTCVYDDLQRWPSPE